MGDVGVAVQGDWDLGLGRRKGSFQSAFVCVQRRSSAAGMGGYVFNPESKPLPSQEDIVNGNRASSSSMTDPWSTSFLSLLGGIPGLQSRVGSNTLAIDNKIGEAMDLVKSHLMITVRAEVAVLKEQIKELKEKNSKLEYENSILKAAASQETLAKLSQP